MVPRHTQDRRVDPLDKVMRLLELAPPRALREIAGYGDDIGVQFVHTREQRFQQVGSILAKV